MEESVEKELIQKIAGIVAKIAEKDVNLVKIDTDLQAQLGIDSMMGLEIMYGIEKEFKITSQLKNLLSF